ncbi:MAG: ABC transporter ATP-binding protein [Acidimicrobiales bacterium]
MTTGLSADISLRLGALDLAARLDVAAGETVAVLGPNGAGKTSLLAAIAGLGALDAGRIVLDGEVLEDTATGEFVEPERRPIGVLFQDYLLFPHLSTLDNVAFGLRCRGVHRTESRGRAREWLDRVGLADHSDTHPGELSGGQAQRVALARALITEPRLLLLDEPLSALDATTRATTRRDLRRHLADYDGVRIVVTHDPVEAAALADRLVVLEKGRVVQVGTPVEVSAHPRSRYVADLVGVNLMSGHGRHDQVAIGADSHLTVAAPVEGDLLAVIHPRAVSLHRHAPSGSPRNVWEGHITALDRGSEGVRVQVGGPLPIVAEVTLAAIEDLGFAEGDHVWVSVKATEISVFPA